MVAHAVRSISAPPEVVYNTATDPHRAAAWLPADLGLEMGAVERYEVHLTAGGNAAGTLRVHPGDAGGAQVDLHIGDRDRPLDEMLDNLARAVGENLDAS